MPANIHHREIEEAELVIVAVVAAETGIRNAITVVTATFLPSMVLGLPVASTITPPSRLLNPHLSRATLLRRPTGLLLTLLLLTSGLLLLALLILLLPSRLLLLALLLLLLASSLLLLALLTLLLSSRLLLLALLILLLPSRLLLLALLTLLLSSRLLLLALLTLLLSSRLLLLALLILLLPSRLLLLALLILLLPSRLLLLALLLLLLASSLLLLALLILLLSSRLLLPLRLVLLFLFSGLGPFLRFLRAPDSRSGDTEQEKKRGCINHSNSFHVLSPSNLTVRFPRLVRDAPCVSGHPFHAKLPKIALTVKPVAVMSQRGCERENGTTQIHRAATTPRQSPRRRSRST